MKKYPLNQILYGPPGTGKTYETKELAVRIVAEQKVIEDIDNASSEDERRKIINKEYNKHLSNRIQFVTFHQSYGYEDFVEGIKPVISRTSVKVENSESEKSKDILYHIQNGIFKKICRDAKDAQEKLRDAYTGNSLRKKPKEEFSGRKVWFVMLGSNGEYKWDCFLNGYIRRGSRFIDYDLADTTSQFFKEKKEEFKKIHGKKHQDDIPKLEKLCLDMEQGNLIMVHGYKHSICAVGEVDDTGYKYLAGKESYMHSRGVKWLWINEENPIDVKSISKGIGLKYMDGLYQNARLKSEDLIELVHQNLASRDEGTMTGSDGDVDEPKVPYVLIIDEINRGNISKILGELITLIEDDKRAGESEALEVTLPYSGAHDNSKFSVPNNLYIIGTMNTADRSIAFLDAALRRRFDFIEVMPKPYLDQISQDVEGVNLQELLGTMNDRIKEYLDRDHQIGHSYFMKVNSIRELANTFRNNICPLLDEYFYDQRELVLEVLKGSELINKESQQKNKNWEWAAYDNDVHKNSTDSPFLNPNSYTKIYKKGQSE